MYRFIYPCALAALVLQPSTGDAVEALSTDELTLHCAVYEKDPEGTDGVFCVRYIQGFIDGAVVTDERVTFNVADEYDSDPSFAERLTERAIRTRLGTRLQHYGPSYYAEFCLGEPVPLKSVVELVIADLVETVENRPLLARDIVYSTLRREFPCAVDPEQ